MEEKKEPFVVDSLAKANWVVDKINEKRAKIDEVNTAVNEMIDKYEAWGEEQTHDLQEEIDSLQMLLKPWARKELGSGKKKSIKLAGGVVGFRKGAEKWMMGGEVAAAGNEKLLTWVKRNANEYIKTIEAVRWADFKKKLNVMKDGRVCTLDGEIVDGLTVEQEPDTFYVK